MVDVYSINTEIVCDHATLYTITLLVHPSISVCTNNNTYVNVYDDHRQFIW